eukprot:626748-Hanusia_phi.AAC.7
MPRRAGGRSRPAPPPLRQARQSTSPRTSCITRARLSHSIPDGLQPLLQPLDHLRQLPPPSPRLLPVDFQDDTLGVTTGHHQRLPAALFTCSCSCSPTLSNPTSYPLLPRHSSLSITHKVFLNANCRDCSRWGRGAVNLLLSSSSVENLQTVSHDPVHVTSSSTSRSRVPCPPRPLPSEGPGEKGKSKGGATEVDMMGTDKKGERAEGSRRDGGERGGEEGGRWRKRRKRRRRRRRR